ncbi:MAG: ATP synthase F1 subunit gamma [Spirochaetaceae bacterium]|jgi:F-type H+-transporting ATPase subunit gamma|nr:ATP synthase F1 subunit gamma [Spirochaetaceae bacterium]
MANLRDVRLRMKAIGQTLQVTKAMGLISTSKLRKGRRVLEQTEPFFNRVQKTMSDLLYGADTVQSRFFRHNDDGYTAIVAVTSDKGLAGGYNANVFRTVASLCEQVKNPVLILIGAVGQRYFVNSPYLVLENFSFASRLPTVDDAQEIADYIVSQFDWGVFREVRIVYTHMYNALKLLPCEREVLPLDEEKMKVERVHADPARGSDAGQSEVSDFAYLPSSKEVFDALAPLYIKGIVYGCLVESYASEQSARMSAMNDSTKNAVDMLSAQQTHYNRVRQTGITQEITEIVSGAAAQTDGN